MACAGAADWGAVLCGAGEGAGHSRQLPVTAAHYASACWAGAHGLDVLLPGDCLRAPVQVGRLAWHLNCPSALLRGLQYCCAHWCILVVAIQLTALYVLKAASKFWRESGDSAQARGSEEGLHPCRTGCMVLGRQMRFHSLLLVSERVCIPQIAMRQILADAFTLQLQGFAGE